MTERYDMAGPDRNKAPRWNVSTVIVLAFLGLSLVGQVVFADKPWLQLTLSIILLMVCVYPTLRYFARREQGLPTAAVFGLVYAFQFVVPVFSRDPIIELTTGVNELSENDVTAAVAMALLAIIALLGGFYASQRPGLRKGIPIVHLPLNRSKAIFYCAIVTVLVPAMSVIQDIVPPQFEIMLSAFIRLMYAQSLIAIGILGWIVYSRRSPISFYVWLYLLVGVSVARGIADGSLEGVVVPLAVVFVIRWLYTGKVALGPAAVVFASMIFLSPVKSEFRDSIWYGSSPVVGFAKTALWINLATDFWGDTLIGARDLSDATSRLAGRTDLIHQLAHIHELTPVSVPFQNGGTYGYFAVALVPRILWPEKPEAGGANYFFATNYALTTEEGAQRTTFGVSLVGEAYINFGWPGVAAIMLVCGLLLGALQYAFGESHSGVGGQVIFLAFFVFFLNGMGTSAEIMFGNILQNLIAAYFILVWARERYPRQIGAQGAVPMPR